MILGRCFAAAGGPMPFDQGAQGGTVFFAQFIVAQTLRCGAQALHQGSLARRAKEGSGIRVEPRGCEEPRALAADLCRAAAAQGDRQQRGDHLAEGMMIVATGPQTERQQIGIEQRFTVEQR